MCMLVLTYQGFYCADVSSFAIIWGLPALMMRRSKPSGRALSIVPLPTRSSCLTSSKGRINDGFKSMDVWGAAGPGPRLNSVRVSAQCSCQRRGSTCTCQSKRDGQKPVPCMSCMPGLSRHAFIEFRISLSGIGDRAHWPRYS